MNRSRGIGARGERIASQWLRRRGWRVLHRNHRVGLDEIDIVAESPDGKLMACIEVKTASRSAGTPPLCRVDGRKQHRLLRSARRVAPGYPNHLVRIDIMTVQVGGWRRARVHHLPGAVPNRQGQAIR
ncbi:MAG: YraN family protein [Planctomycetota bacterium]|nr:YraN family protein [Planctomycetota bacterium]